MPITSKKTLDLILSINCHFLAQVKRNCRRLWEDIALFTALGRPISSCQYYEQKHGHKVHRKVELYVNEITLPEGWNGIQRLIKVRRWGTRNRLPFEQVAFYVLSKPINSAYVVAQAIQGHWAIENKLHWPKDVILREDHMTLRHKHAVSILVYLNNIAINLITAAGYKPIKDTFAKFANKVNELGKLLNVDPIS